MGEGELHQITLKGDKLHFWRLAQDFLKRPVFPGVMLIFGTVVPLAIKIIIFCIYYLQAKLQYNLQTSTKLSFILLYLIIRNIIFIFSYLSPILVIWQIAIEWYTSILLLFNKKSLSSFEQIHKEPLFI